MKSVCRRSFIRWIRDGLGMFAVGALTSRADAATEVARMPGTPISAYGVRSHFERAARWLTPARFPTSTASWTPLGELDGRRRPQNEPSCRR